MKMTRVSATAVLLLSALIVLGKRHDGASGICCVRVLPESRRILGPPRFLEPRAGCRGGF